MLREKDLAPLAREQLPDTLMGRYVHVYAGEGSTYEINPRHGEIARCSFVNYIENWLANLCPGAV